MRKFKSSNREIFDALSLLTQLGIAMAVTILLSFFIGKKLDEWLFTSPLFLLIFIVFGVLAGFRNLYKMTHRFWYKKDNLDKIALYKERKSDLDRDYDENTD